MGGGKTIEWRRLFVREGKREGRGWEQWEGEGGKGRKRDGKQERGKEMEEADSSTPTSSDLSTNISTLPSFVLLLRLPASPPSSSSFVFLLCRDNIFYVCSEPKPRNLHTPQVHNRLGTVQYST